MTTAGIDALYTRRSAELGAILRGPEMELFARVRDQARWGRVWSWLTGRPRNLYALSQVTEACSTGARTDGGIRSVPISRIQGSQGRCGYFDRDFRPLHDQARERWQSIARARRQGKQLPPVSLVQVGNIYFVSDGHHRISVARALGQGDIEARVTVWQVTGPLPWEAPQDQPGPTRAFRTLQRRVALVLQTVLVVVEQG